MRALQLHVLSALIAVFAAVGARRSTEPVLARGIALVDCVAQRVELRGTRSVTITPTDGGAEITVVTSEDRIRFVGGRSAMDLLDELGELRAIRSFEAEPSVDYGFGDDRLRVVCAGRTIEWAVGASPPGSADRYLRGEGSTVHLVAGGVLRALEEAEVRLVRRALHDFEEAAVARVELTLPDGRTVAMEQRFADDRNRRRWVAPDAPEEVAPRFDRLMGAHRNLRVDAGADGGGELLGSMRFLDADGTPLGHLELTRTGEGPRSIYHARTDALGWVRLPRSTGAAFAAAIERLQ